MSHTHTWHTRHTRILSLSPLFYSAWNAKLVDAYVCVCVHVCRCGWIVWLYLPRASICITHKHRQSHIHPHIIIRACPGVTKTTGCRYCTTIRSKQPETVFFFFNFDIQEVSFHQNKEFRKCFLASSRGSNMEVRTYFVITRFTFKEICPPRVQPCVAKYR